jgi:hypothetical protein
MHMRNPLGVFTELMRRPIWMPVWVFFLMIINVASIGFWDEPLAKPIFITFMISAILRMGLYTRFDFEKRLELGHILWIPLLIYVLTQLSVAEGDFRSRLAVLSVSIAIWLAFDITDVWK